MTARIRSIDCPSCGAPLQMPTEGKHLFKCRYCGATLEDLTTSEQRQSGGPPTVVVRSARVASLPPAVAARPDRVGRLVGCIAATALVLGVVVALFASGVLAIGGRGGGPAGGLRVYSFGLARLVPAGDESRPDVIGVTRNSDETDRMVYLDWEGERPLRWQSEPLGEGADYLYNPVVAGRQAVYMAYKTTLVALDRQAGDILWQGTLSDEVSNICRDCLGLFGDWLVALTADGVLNGIDATTGEPAWTVRLNETPRQMMNLAGKPGVLDKVDGAVGINVYETATGTLVERLVPQCPNEVFENDPQELSIYDPVLVSAGGTEFYVPISEWRPGCLQKWDAASLTMVWQATMPEEAIDALDREPYLLTGRELYTSDGHTLFLVDLADGACRPLFSDQDHNLAPLAAREGVLAVLAERTRGTRQYLLWGVDPAAGVLRWQLDPAAEEHDDGGSDVVYSEGIWTAALAEGQVLVLEAFSDPSVLSFTALRLSDGAHTGTSAFALGDDDSSYWLQVLGWDDNRVYLEMDNRLWLMDATTGEEIARWPN
jgi:outer membrane protein assembly factor BamB